MSNNNSKKTNHSDNKEGPKKHQQQQAAERRQDNNKNNNSFVEKVLALSGGGSLGAYECGACSEFYKNGIKFNMFAGCSIGAINVSILASAQNGGKDPAKVLREFWDEMAEDLPQEELLTAFQSFAQNAIDNKKDPKQSHLASKARAITASMHTAFFGTPKAFSPRWFSPSSIADIQDSLINMMREWWNPFAYFPFAWSYLYDSYPLKQTLKDFIDFDTLRKNPDAGTSDQAPARLIITATDIQRGEAVIFDTAKTDIDADRIIAGASYPFYGIKWHMVDERYLWDGSLLSNTPFSEVLFASPAIDKEFYIVDVFPRDQQKIPGSMAEVWHRARDITFLDKADKIIQMASQRREHISLIRNMREIVSQITQDKNLDDNSRKKLAEIDEQFNKVMKDSSAVVRDIVRVTRSEKVHYILEDADFTRKRIHRLIEEGENDAKNALKTPNRQQEMQKSEHRPKEVEYKTSDNRYQMVT